MTNLIENRHFSLTLRADGGFDFTLKKAGVCYRQLPSEYRVSAVNTSNDCIIFKLDREEGICNGTASLTENGFTVTLSGSGKQSESLAWPPAWEMRRGDLGIYPVGTGLAVPVDDAEFPLDDGVRPVNGATPMLFYGFLRAGRGVFSAADDGVYAAWKLFKVNQLRHAQTVWIDSKGMWQEDKSIRFFFANDLSGGCRMYRRWREEQGRIVTLRDKSKVSNQVKYLAGLADVWLWDDNNMNRLYGRPEEAAFTPRIPERFADEMLSLGMTRILWNSFEGESPDDCRRLKERGFLVGKYDIYRDVLPKTEIDKVIPYRVKRSINTPCWPGIVRVNRDGSYAEAWQIHGLDGKFHSQHAVCELAALDLTRKNVPPEVEKVGYNSRLVDVQAGACLCECWSKEHPATRRDSLNAILEQHEFLCNMGLLTGVENGMELTLPCYHYSEGLMSIGEFRAYESGRRMTTVYNDGDTPEFFRKYMLNPAIRIPLWQLVYHDRSASYWYWGDSTNCCPAQMPLRDLFCALYGEGPLYSFAAGQWNTLKAEIAESYRRSTRVCAATRFEEMISFEVLTEDRLVQRTKFANGIVVTANFSDHPFESEKGVIIDSTTYLMECV